MRSLRGVAATMAWLAMLTTTHRAQADGARCTAAAEDGQRARAAGQLVSARRQFLECSAEDCPALVRRDCAQWASSVAESLPTIVVDARDGAGRDVGDVSVSIDGTIVASSLDGKAIPVDPGPHTLVFARAGSPPVTEKVIIKEGARGRTFVVRLGGAAVATSDAPKSADTSAPTGAPRGHTWPPWLLVGVGAAFAGTGVVLLATTPALPAGCDASTSQCTQLSADETPASLKQRQNDAGRAKNQPRLGAVVIGGGLLIVTGGLLWHFLERTGPAPAPSQRGARIVPWSTSSGAGVAAVGTF
jgi:hypothetical protein